MLLGKKNLQKTQTRSLSHHVEKQIQNRLEFEMQDLKLILEENEKCFWTLGWVMAFFDHTSKT